MIAAQNSEAQLVAKSRDARIIHRNAQASYQNGRNLGIMNPTQQALGLRAVMRMIEGGFLQPIQHETGTEAGVEEHMQGAVEVVVRGRLPNHGDAFLGASV